MASKGKNARKPAAERQVGFQVVLDLGFGLLLAVAYIFAINHFYLDYGTVFEGMHALVTSGDMAAKVKGDVITRELVKFVALSVYMSLFLMNALYFGRTKYTLFWTNFDDYIGLPMVVAGLTYAGAWLSSVPDIGPIWFLHFKIAAIAILPPLLIPALVIAPSLVKEYVKELPLYRRLFVLSKGEEAARWAGIRQFIAMDWAREMRLGRTWLYSGGQSAIYLGKTLFENDFRLFGRHVALQSEQHMMTIATTGGGKSRDAIWNTLLTYCGGVICFDPKGEHVRVTYKRRKSRASVFVLDPYGEVRDVQATNYWNPLDEINAHDPSAREKIKRLASACVYAEKGEGGNAAHFRENAQIILRGFIAYAKAELPQELRTLPVVYDLLATGEPNGKFANPAKWENLLAEMATCEAFGGAPRDAAGLLMKVSERERGAYISTIVRGMDWVNGQAVRAILSKPSDFSLSVAKSHEGTIFLVSPEQHIEEMSRFMRMFYTVAFDVCDSHVTPQPQGSERRVLFIFDEFNKLGTFKPAEDAILVKRSSHIKCWFIVQNMGQLFANYENPDNFLSCCDQQYFGMARTDSKAPELLEKALGQYIEGRYEGEKEAPHYIETKRPLLSRSDLAEFVNNESDLQIVIPIKGRPMKLRRVPYFKNFAKASYGQRSKLKTA